jgi:enoyl-[acyl-carrier protein] reductase I
MNFLNLNDKNVLIFGVANRRSVAYAISKVLKEAGARLLYVVRNDEIRDSVRKLLGEAPILTCDVEKQEEINALPEKVAEHCDCLHGLVHSIAFANYSGGFCSFHETGRRDFLQAMDISCFSFVSLARAFKPMLAPDASLLTMSISTTGMAAENYGYMGPIKAALNSSVVFLAKSLGTDTRIRVNAVGAGLLKTSASAGIPGYIDSYLYAEKVIPRRASLETEEVANTAAFLLSPRSSGINAQVVTVDAGMAINYFDRQIVRRVVAD